MKIFMDSEFSGLHKDTTLISMGLVSDDDYEFYCELTDYDENQIDDWLKENVMNNLLFQKEEPFCQTFGNMTYIKGTKEEVKNALTVWLLKFDKVELWSDCQHYDIVLFLDIFGSAFEAPDHVYYIPFDICTVMKVYGLDPDVNREAFIDTPIKGAKHNALYDAKVIRACYDKLYRNRHKYPFMQNL